MHRVLFAFEESTFLHICFEEGDRCLHSISSRILKRKFRICWKVRIHLRFYGRSMIRLRAWTSPSLFESFITREKFGFLKLGLSLVFVILC